jgi:hypothetical protein
MSNFNSMVSGNFNTNNSTDVNTDFDIFNVGNTLNSNNFIYDGQTVLLINSSINQSSNLVQLSYFNPVTGVTGSGATGFNEWNFDLVSNSFLNGTFTQSSLLSSQTNLYNNLENTESTVLNTYNLDISNGGETNGNNTLFVSLTSKPYFSYKGVMYNSPGTMGAPTIQNVNPGYSTTNTSSFLFVSSYYKPTMNEILIIEISIIVNNTDSMNYNSTSSSQPTVSAIIVNKVLTREMLAGLGSGNNNFKPKVYTAGPIPLQYLSSGSSFDPKTASSFLYNNIPIIIADNYEKVYGTVPLIYVPPETTTTNGQYLVQQAGYIIDNNIPVVDTTAGVGIDTVASGTTQYGHLVFGIAYSQNTNIWIPGINFYSQILIKNIWRSPIAIYNSYEAFSLNDMATKLVVLLFGKSKNGGTFLVTNTGTPLNVINNYAVTSLGNFMQIMKGIIQLYNNTYSLVDYFINPNTIDYLNERGFNVKICILQPLLAGSISNPATIETNPNMQYMLLNAKNSVNMSIDPINQMVFNQTVNYYNLTNSMLSSVGLINYKNDELEMISTDSGSLFGNSLYLGLQTINNQQFYVLVILPEALFNAQITEGNNVLSVYSSPSSLFYLNVNANSSSQFAPTSNNTVTSSSTSQFSNSVSSTYQVTKLNMSVSNDKII